MILNILVFQAKEIDVSTLCGEDDFVCQMNAFWTAPFLPNLLNSTVFLVETSQMIAVFFTNYKGRRKSSYLFLYMIYFLMTVIFFYFHLFYSTIFFYTATTLLFFSKAYFSFFLFSFIINLLQSSLSLFSFLSSLFFILFLSNL